MTRQASDQVSDGQHDAAATRVVIGDAPLLLICDHASNFVPLILNDLGLTQAQLHDHIGWDIGAGALTHTLAKQLNASAVLANFSRLVIDANRAIDAHDLIPSQSDGIVIPGNADLTAAQRQSRVTAFHSPFHDHVAAVLQARRENAPITTIVSIHTFTPQLNMQKTKKRPWHMGLLFHRDARLAYAVAAQCHDEPHLVIGLNEPYAPTDGVYYTLDRHAGCEPMLNLLIEVRNDLLRTAADIELWAHRLARWIKQALAVLLAETPQTTDKLASLA